MSNVEIILPAMGEGIIEATVTRWLVEEGAVIEEDDPIVEVATDKVDTEIPSPASGVLSKIFYKEGEIPKVGEVIALLKTSKDVGKEESYTPVVPEPEIIRTSLEKQEDKKKSRINTSSDSDNNTKPTVKGPRFISPFIRFQAMKREVSYNELLLIKGTGDGGRLTKEDLNDYIREGRKFRQDILYDVRLTENADDSNHGDMHMYEYSPLSGDEIIPMDRTRKLIARHMTGSKKISPHVTSMVEIDVTALVNWRNEVKDDFLAKYGSKLTYTPIIIDAVVKAIQKYRGINVSVVGENIVRKKDINIGVATALLNGNLIVPVIKNADKENLSGIAIKVQDLSTRARENKLLPSEIKGSTFTITNMGQYDNISGTPIINQPEVAILAVGAIRKKPGVYEFNGQQTIGIRDILILSLTYDHRVVDGSLGGSFLRQIGEYLENFDTNIRFY